MLCFFVIGNYSVMFLLHKKGIESLSACIICDGHDDSLWVISKIFTKKIYSTRVFCIFFDFYFKGYVWRAA